MSYHYWRRYDDRKMIALGLRRQEKLRLRHGYHWLLNNGGIMDLDLPGGLDSEAKNVGYEYHDVGRSRSDIFSVDK